MSMHMDVRMSLPSCRYVPSVCAMSRNTVWAHRCNDVYTYAMVVQSMWCHLRGAMQCQAA
eukprot:5430191-Pyramimonas_sp.AAC.1